MSQLEKTGTTCNFITTAMYAIKNLWGKHTTFKMKRTGRICFIVVNDGQALQSVYTAAKGIGCNFLAW